VNPRVLAWGVHLFTGLGLIAAAGVAALIVQRNAEGAFALMLVATLIDALDGTLARAARVSKCSRSSTAAVSTTSSISRRTPASPCC
jgi:phosphatidylserine synthase